MTIAAMRYTPRSKSNGQNLFRAVSDGIQTRDAAVRYGLPVSRSGMCKCPFHQDKNPSMKVDKRFHCFGCQADGDVIDFTSRLFGFNRIAAAKKLAADFGIRWSDHARWDYVPVKKQRKITEEEILKHRVSHCYSELCDYRNLLVRWQEEYAPKGPEDEFHPLFVEALIRLPEVENDLDILWDGPDSEKKTIIKEMESRKEKEVRAMDGAISVPVYYENGIYARDHKELELFRNSHMENINCKKAIEESIARNFDGMRLNKSAVTHVLDQYGAERVSLVLAATVQTKSWDGRFSNQNKDWAFSVRMPDARPDSDYDRRDAYAVTSHPAVLDGFINHVRREIRERSLPSIHEELKAPAGNAQKPPSRQAEIER